MGGAPLKHHLGWKPLSPAVSALEAVGPGRVEPIRTAYALRVEKGHMGEILNNSSCVSSQRQTTFFFFSVEAYKGGFKHVVE